MEYNPRAKILIDRAQKDFKKIAEGLGWKLSCVNWIIAWLYSGFNSPMLALFDNDAAGKASKKEVFESEHYKNKQQAANIKLMSIEPSEDIITAYKLNVNVDFEIENLFSEKVWNEWKKKRYAVLHSDDILKSSLFSIIPRN